MLKLNRFSPGSIPEWITAVLTAVAVALAATVASKYQEASLNAQDRSNVTAYENRLESEDQRLRYEVISRPWTANIFLQISEHNSSESLSLANRMFWSYTKTDERASLSNLNFTGIMDLSCRFWSFENSASFQGYMPSYFFAENILYLVYGAERSKPNIESRDKDLIERVEDVNSNYTAYLSDVGLHPTFLLALLEAAKWEYMEEPAFETITAYLLDEFANDPTSWEFNYLRAVFPELVNGDRMALFGAQNGKCQ